MNGAECGKCGHITCVCDQRRTEKTQCAIEAIEDAILNRTKDGLPIDMGLNWALELLKS